jgi:hypothetical protein
MLVGIIDLVYRANRSMAQNSDKQTKFWKPQTLRVSGFLAPIKAVEPEKWWEQLVGKAPDNTVARPSRGEWTLTSEFRGNSLGLSVQPGRFDWWLAPDAAKPNSDDDKVPVLSEQDEIAETFFGLMSRWLTLSPAILRLAYGAVLVGDVGDKVSGYKELARFVPDIKIDPENSQDFFYQINRPRKSAVDKSLSVNRLSKWSIASFAAISVAVMAPQMVSSSVGKASFGCRLELDISTPADRTVPLPPENLPGFLQELVILGEEIATAGDIP